MNEMSNKTRLNLVLNDLSRELDVPPSKYQEAKDHYEAVGAWLGADDSELALHNPVIYPQGSFALGTAVRPIGDEEYDVDAACLLELTTDDVTQKQLKDLVGRRLLHSSSRYKDMVEPKTGGRRCWTIDYSDSSRFHLDVLPCIPDHSSWRMNLEVDPELVSHAIRITDNRTPEYEHGWPENGNDPTRSNPRGYAAWFKSRMRVRLFEEKRDFARLNKAEVEQIEDHQVRTPLQRLVQILKRHRDVRYNGDEDKPISIIITTLAAWAYDNEANLADALLNVVPRMRSFVKKRDGIWWVANPVNPQENFADKWAENPNKMYVFFSWLGMVEREAQQLLTDEGWSEIGRFLELNFGNRDAQSVMKSLAEREQNEGRKVDNPKILVPPKSEKPSTHRTTEPRNPGKPWGNA